jgi:hypothetical protein
MDTSSIFSDAFKYTRRMFDDLGRLVILIVLIIIPIVNFIVMGYTAKVIRESPTSTEPPALKDYWEMCIQGLKIFVASLIWMVAPIIMIVASITLVSVSFDFSATTYPDPATMGTLSILCAIGITVAFIIAIIMCIGIVHMIKQNRFSKAFAVREIFDIIKCIGWGKYILWLIIIFGITTLIFAIGSIPYAGWLISLIIGPLYTVFIARSALLIYSEGIPAPPTPPSTALPAETRYCKNCGESLPADASFCPKCGQKAE